MLTAQYPHERPSEGATMKRRNRAAEMESSWLIQRLKKPHGALLGGLVKDNPFSFGGGLKNGGLRDEAMDLLRSIFSFDYMGAAEFEFGAVPKALAALADDATNLVAFSHTLDEGTVYVVCAKADADEVRNRVTEWAKKDYGLHLKEQPRLASSLSPKNEWDGDVCGWLELDNGFFFFTDEAMWQQTAALFGVSTPATSDSAGSKAS